MRKELNEESYRGLLVKLGLGDRNLNAGNRNTVTQRAVEQTGKKLLRDLESKRIEYQRAGLQNNESYHKLLQEADRLQKDVDQLGELKQYLASRDKALSQATGLDVLMAQQSEHELTVQSIFSELLDGLKLSRSNINTLTMDKVKETGRVLRSECADYEMRTRLSGFQFYDADRTEETIGTPSGTETLGKLQKQVRQLDELESYISQREQDREKILNVLLTNKNLDAKTVRDFIRAPEFKSLDYRDVADIFSSNPNIEPKKVSGLIQEFKTIGIRLDAKDAAKLLTVRSDMFQETRPMLIDLISKSHNISRSVDQYVAECTNGELKKKLGDIQSDTLATAPGTIAGSMLKKRQSSITEKPDAQSQNDTDSPAKESERKFVKK